MTYPEGLQLLWRLLSEAPSLERHSNSHVHRGFEIKYPGRKGLGDYALFHNNHCPTHEEIVREIYQLTTAENFEDLVRALEDIHANGDSADTTFFSDSFKTLLFLITLQEECNYPPPSNGRNLPFWRFYEAALAKLGVIDLRDVVTRTNNHGKHAPKPYLKIGANRRPAFYR